MNSEGYVFKVLSSILWSSAIPAALSTAIFLEILTLIISPGEIPLNSPIVKGWEVFLILPAKGAEDAPI